MNLRCRLLSLLRVHSPDCELCSEKYGREMLKRLEELTGRKKPDSLRDGDHGEVAEVYGSKPAEGVGRSPVSSKAKRKSA